MTSLLRCFVVVASFGEWLLSFSAADTFASSTLLLLLSVLICLETWKGEMLGELTALLLLLEWLLGGGGGGRLLLHNKSADWSSAAVAFCAAELAGRIDAFWAAGKKKSTLERW